VSFGSAHAASWGSDEAGEVYERSRSGYPARLAELLTGELGLGRSSVVADVAAGTGKFTRLLVDVTPSVIAVEPAPGMRRQLHRAVPQASVVAAPAESLPFRSRSLDAVTAAQAFHWFRHGDALAEFARVLRPGGVVALVWNVDDPVLEAGAGPEGAGLAAAGLSAAVRAVCDRYERLRPRPAMRWRATLEQAPGWGPLGEVRVDGSERLDVDTLVERVASRSFALLLEPADQRALLAEVRALAEPAAAPDGTVTIPTVTVMFWRCRT
jgi:SAM-dependent methyltransferase